MADVVLIQPLETEDDAKGPTLASMENLGLGYLKSTLAQAGISVSIINAEAEGYDADRTTALAIGASPSIVGLTPVAMTMRSTLAICEAIKRARPATITILGGHHATLCSADILTGEPAVDYVFRGDGEKPLLRFCQAILDGLPIPDIPSLATREKYFAGAQVPMHRENELDSLPWPSRETAGAGSIPVEARLVTSRGCWFRCSFCTTPSFYTSTLLRDVGEVIKEIEHLYSLGIRHIWLNDDLFVANSPASHRRTRQFCDQLCSSHAKVHFRPMVRADSFNRDRSLIHTLIEAGMSHVFVGVEAGNEPDLLLYRKDIDVTENVATVRELKTNSTLVFQMGFIMFNPLSTPESLRTNFAFLKNIGESYRAFPLFRCLSVFPNTSIAEELTKVGMIGAVTYKSETPYSYDFANESVGTLARFQHQYYRAISGYDSAVYRCVSRMRFEGNAEEAECLAGETSAINEAYFHAVLRLVDRKCVDVDAYKAEFARYLERFRSVSTSLGPS